MDSVHATEQWFIAHGLPYFVPRERQAAGAALHPRRTVPLALLVGAAAVLLAVLLARASDRFSAAPATLTLVGVLAAVLYAVTALRARPLVAWALRRTAGGLREIVPMVTRALPLLLVFVTFLFINAEVWHVSANLDGGLLWLTVLLFTVMGVAFFLVELPAIIDEVDDDLSDERIVAVTRDTPVGEDAARIAAEGRHRLADEIEVSAYERANLSLAMLVTQLAQVLLLALTLLTFFVVLGAIAMDHDVTSAWIGEEVHAFPGLPNVSAELLQVAVFLAAFSGLYFTVTAITDETYKHEFLSKLMAELERAVAVRAVYVTLRREREEGGSGATAAPPPDDAPTMPLSAPEEWRRRPPG